MPENTLLFYHERSGIDSILSHDNANRFINYLIEEEGRPVIRVKSNHEISRTIGGKSPGFTTDYAYAVHVILLADYFDLDSIGTGMPLENSYMFHGQRFRDFNKRISGVNILSVRKCWTSYLPAGHGMLRVDQ